jgi:hypothetical protein
MKPTLRSTRAALSLAMLAALTFSGCASSGSGSGTETHEMGPPKGPYRMSNESMPGR